MQEYFHFTELLADSNIIIVAQGNAHVWDEFVVLDNVVIKFHLLEFYKST